MEISQHTNDTNHGEQLSFCQLFTKKNMLVEIPIIQRDYAQGRLESELLSNLVYGIQAAFSVDCSSSCLPFLKMTLLTTKVNKLNP